MSDPSISYPHQQHNHHHYQHHNHHHHHHHHQQQSAVLNASSPTTSIAGVDSAQVVYRQSRTERRSNSFAMATCYSAYELSPPQPPPPPPPPAPQRTVQVPVQKDYSRPLHVDCSVEYELPNTAKPPQGVRNEPLLMIHPCYFRKIESQRRSPFVNNLPVRQQQQQQQQQQHHQHHQHHHHQQHQQLQQQQQHQPVATAVTTAVKRRRPQQPQAAQYPAPYAAAAPNWEQMPPLVPISQAYKRDPMSSITSTSISTSACAAYSSSSGSDSGHWTDPDHSPDRPDDINNKQQQSHHQQQQHHHHHHHQQHILTGKYRQYLRAHRLHPYVTSAIPLASTFPQIQQVCYNV